MVKPGINEDVQLVPCEDMFKMYISGEEGQVNYFTATEESIATKLILGSECSQYNIALSGPSLLMTSNYSAVWTRTNLHSLNTCSHCIAHFF